MPRIFDNLSPETQLLGALRQTMDGATRADFCVGYFNLRGWAGLVDGVDGLAPGAPACRVLVGMQPTVEERIRLAFPVSREPESPDQQTILRLRRKMAEAFREQLTVGLPTARDEAALRRLREQLVAGAVQIKLFLRHPLHAKLYLIHRPDQIAPLVGYLGSSNLTFAGLSHQGELNVDVVENDAACKLQRWFDDRWRDRWALDISDELVAIIDESWASPRLTPPYHVYLKMAYHLSREAREGIAEFRIPKDFGVELFDFQKAAVQIAARHVNARGGVLLGDVVGLGKTLMASALARVLQDDLGLETLVICPKNLETMWRQAVERHRMLAHVLPLSRAIGELPELRRYRVVLIDESHNLRNPEGRQYRAVREYILANDSRVILLSATPYNKTYLDLAAQLRLFVPEDSPLPIRPEALLREIGEAEFTRRYQCNVRTLKAFEQSEHADDWRELMRRYLVRRTRSFIIDNYAERDERGRPYLPIGEGGRAYFPDRIPKTVRFAFGEPYARLFAPTVVDAIDGLRLPRYGLGNYIAARLTPLPNDAERRDLAGLNRAGVRLKGFCRTNLFKRLESGGPAFLQSLERHAIRNFVVLHALEQGLEAPIGTQDGVDFDSRFTDRDADDALPAAEDDSEMPETTPPPLRAEADYRAVGARLFELYRGAARGRFKWLRASLFTSELRDDLLADARAVLDVLDWCGAWEPAHDAKLQALARLIRDEHPHEKILVFTQFADTVAYLERELTRLGIADLAGATAEDPNPARLAWRFSPRSNQQEALAARDGELRVLVATDVLSEGQNLQDAAIVVNYDLPWAIIRLIQRVGRVDRIGQGAEDILCYSFLPAEGIEAILRLRGRLRTRLSANAEVVGTDEAFFEDDVSERPLLDLYNERAGILDEADDLGVDPTSDAYQIWKNAVDANPRLAKIVPALPDVVYATRSHAPLPGQPDGVLLYVRGGDGADSLAWIDEQGRIVTESALDVLRAAACHPDTPALPRSERHHELVESGARQMLAEQANAGGQLGRPSGARFRVYQRLTAYIARLDGQLGMFDPGRTEAGLAPNLDGLKRAVQDIYDHPLLPAATDSLNRLLRANASDEELGRRAIDLRERDELTVPDNDAERREPRIICSLGLVAPPA